MITLLELLLASIVVTLVYVAGVAACVGAVGVRITEVTLFTPPTLGRFVFKGVKFCWGFNPLCGGLSMEREDYEKLGPARTLTLTLAGPLATFVLATLCLGPGRADRLVLDGFPEIVLGAFAPLSTGSNYVKQGLGAATDQSFATQTGMVAAKLTAFNLLPIPTFAGGMAMLIPFRLLLRSEKVKLRIAIASLLCTVALWVAWCVALIHALL